MKQYAVIFLMVGFGVVGAIGWTPACAVCMYYFFAVFRPQWIWKFQLSAYPGLQQMTWSFYLAAAAIGSYLAWSIGLISYGRSEKSVMRYSPAMTLAHVAMLAFAGWITLSFIFSNNQKVSEDWYGEYVKIFVMYFVAWRVIRTANQVWALYMLTAFALAYIALDANQIYFSTGSVVLYRRGYALLDNNGAGLLLALGVPLCVFAWEMTYSRIRWFWLVGAVMIVHAVMTTYSRGAMISMLAPMPWYMYFAWKFSRNKLHIMLLGMGLASIVPIMAGKEIQERFFSIQKREVDASFQSRQLSWKIAWEIAADYPVFGAGVRCSALEMKKRGADMEGRTIHSQYLQILADSGYTAFALYVVVGACTFYCLWRARLQLWNRKDPEGRRAIAMLNGIECSLVSFFVGALALSLEVFEPSYLLLLLGAQFWALLNASDTFRPEIQNYRQFEPHRRSVPKPPPSPRYATARPTIQGPPTGKHPFERFQQPSARPGGS